MTLTLQQVFENGVRGVYKQGAAAYDIGRAECRYRITEGKVKKKCALGWSIPDKLYRPGMEGQGAHALVRFYPDVAALLPSEVDTLAAFQNCHDTAATKKFFMEDFLYKAWEFGETRGLTWPEDVPVPD